MTDDAFSNRILVVDDEEDFAEGIAEVLETSGYEAKVVFDRESALEAVEQCPDCMALIDLCLGETSGLELIEKIKTLHPDVECLIMTAFADVETAIGAVRKGAYDYLRKPINTDDLLTTLNRCFEKRQLEQEKNQAEEALKKKNQELEEINRRLRKVVASTKGFASCAYLEGFGELLLREFSKNMAAQGGSIYMVGGNALKLIHSLDPDHLPISIPLPLKKGSILDAAIESKNPILIENITEREDLDTSGWIGYRDGSVLVFPLVDDMDEVLGIVSLHNRVDPPFTSQDKELGTLLASHSCETLRALRAMDALKEREQELSRLAIAIDQAAELVFITDTDGNFQYVNPSFEQVTGYNKEEVLGKNVRILKSGRQHMDFYRSMWETITRGDVWRGKLVNKRKDGSLYTEEASITPIKDGKGRIVNFVAVKRDITRLAMLESQLNQAQKMEAMGTLAGGVAHDFNNILSAIMGYTELALLDSKGGGKLTEHLNKLLKASNRAKDLVAQILAFSRSEEHVLMPMDLENIIQDGLKLIRASLPSTIDIRKNLIADDRTILADQTQLGQVIMNICANARDAMRRGGGVLELRLEEAATDSDFSLRYPDLKVEDYLLLTIRDTGHGMPKEILDRIFNPYFTTKEKGEGTGLGLAIVHTIIQNHKGRIRVQSEPGRGTAFYIYLPHAARDAEIQDAGVTSEIIPEGDERILVVDDEEDIVLILKNILTRLGYKVTTCLRSKAALELFKKKPYEFDVIISDMTMPEMTGEMLIARIKEIRPEIPALLCSGYSEALPKGKDSSLGVAGVLRKPISMMDMATTIRNVLDQEKIS